ncbi:glycerol-3-phosphate dehydrogenase [Hellea balneolensis]|uniref:glycerol-3-phosphate dehydrogenase n=1 Tax=Hellea balneolensis TaxID=287478 RepID=UPI00054E4C72|nr:glycerol-3-phosphate dehydrogenase [Hellea balneolensis]
MADYDLLIIGGGINGTAIARDAAGRGLKVLLCERDDLANHTSSSSTKLIHGGLRYLEYYEFKLVRHALIEREVLLRAAPHIIWPMRFVLPYDKGLRPKWMLRAGLFLYDSLGGREKLPGTKTVKLNKPPHQGVLESRLTQGFEYSDCWVEDARLVVLNALDAANRGADIRTRTEVLSIEADGSGYKAEIKTNGTTATVTAKGCINSAGPWVDEVLKKIQRTKNDKSVRLVKGSHIVTKRLFEGDHAYIFQNADNRIIFAIPYERDYTLIGTTDKPYDPSEGKVKISQEEIDYLCGAASEYFENDITPEDVTWTYSGVRPLYDDKSEDASAVTRDYVLELDEFTKDAPFMSIYGGKITTSRKLAEHVMEQLHPFYDYKKKGWTETAGLPGGDIADADFDAFYEKMRKRYRAMEAKVLLRLCHGYGTRVTLILGDGDTAPELGQHFGQGLYEAEARYLINHEWATSADDIIWRRTKLGVHLSTSEKDAFTEWFNSLNS